MVSGSWEELLLPTLSARAEMSEVRKPKLAAGLAAADASLLCVVVRAAVLSSMLRSWEMTASLRATSCRRLRPSFLDSLSFRRWRSIDLGVGSFGDVVNVRFYAVLLGP